MARNDTVRVGLIGTGFGVRAHLPALRAVPGIEVTGIFSSELARAEKLAREHGIPQAYDDYRRLAEARDVDLVSVASTAELHYEHALACLGAGKHILCEKPMAAAIDEVRTMVAKAHASGVIHAVNHELRFLALSQSVRHLVAGGDIGRPMLVVMTMHTNMGTDPRFLPFWWGRLSERSRAGGALMSLFSHYIDLLFFWFGEITEIQGGISAFFPERPVPVSEYGPMGPDSPIVGMRPVETEDSAVFTGRLPGGGLLSFTGSSSLYHPSGVKVEIYGDEGTLFMEAPGFGTTTTTERLLIGAKDDRELRPFDFVSDGNGPRSGNLIGAMSAEITEIVAAIRAGKEGASYANFDDGLRVHEVIHTLIG